MNTKERIEKLKKTIEKMNLLTGHDFKVEVDEMNSNVKIGDDIFMIQYGKLDEYLDLKIKRYELIVDSAQHKGKYTLGVIADQINEIAVECVLLYRTRKDVQA